MIIDLFSQEPVVDLETVNDFYNLLEFNFDVAGLVAQRIDLILRGFTFGRARFAYSGNLFDFDGACRWRQDDASHARKNG